MARLPYLDPDQAETRVAEVLARSPDLGIFRMVANAQRAFPAWMRFGGTLFDSDELDPLLRELAIARVAAMTPGADYEWIQHAAITLAVGGTQEQLDAIARDDIDAHVLGDDGRLVVRFTTQVVRDASPDEETFAAMSARFTLYAPQLVALTAGGALADRFGSATLFIVLAVLAGLLIVVSAAGGVSELREEMTLPAG